MCKYLRFQGLCHPSKAVPKVIMEIVRFAGSWVGEILTVDLLRIVFSPSGFAHFPLLI